MKLNNFFKLIITVGLSLSAGAIGSVVTASKIPTWYAGLIKPALNPPGWVFGPVWTTLYILMGIAAFLVWQSTADKKTIRTALSVFGLQLVLNASWSIIFFGLQNPLLALIAIAGLWLAIVWTIILFYKISKPAAWLLIPYLVWVSFASYLNGAIWRLN